MIHSRKCSLFTSKPQNFTVRSEHPDHHRNTASAWRAIGPSHRQTTHLCRINNCSLLFRRRLAAFFISCDVEVGHRTKTRWITGWIAGKPCALWSRRYVHEEERTSFHERKTYFTKSSSFLQEKFKIFHFKKINKKYHFQWELNFLWREVTKTTVLTRK